MKTHALEQELRERLKLAGLENPAFEARKILCHILSVETADLMMMADAEIADLAINRARDWTEERARGVPLAYLTGIKGFYKFDFHVKPGVLVPRPESEFVVEVALKRMRESGLVVQNFADLGCGTGCIGLSLLSEIPGSHLFAIDSSVVACVVAELNAQSLQADNAVTVVRREVESWTPPSPLQLVVANPPYIPDGDPLVERGVHEHEPHAALYSGTDGLETVRSWSDWTSRNLAKGGLFVCEIGAGQSAAVIEIINLLGFKEIRSQKDLAGIERVISAVKG